MKSGRQFDEQAHCYDDLNNENSNFGTTKGGNQYADDPKGGSGVSGKGSSSTISVNNKVANRGDE